ncbi:MAG: DNA polymerase I [Treponema sp.]|nr:DNA polymerase I [Treponema sp.]
MAAEDKNTVYILDSYGLIFRCYFAFISRPLTNSKGENVSALFGFFRNLHWVLQHYKPECLLAAMDSKTKTFRHQMYEQYKATRNKTPDDLHAQIPWIEEVLQAMGIPVLQCDGYEADDIIATVARKCEEEKRPCRILSGDKDLMQLVTDNTQILKPESGAATWKITTSEGVKMEWGVEPSQLLDLLSLYGDSADNIPGVNGVGVKTASKLLNDYGNLDGIYEHIDEIKGAMQKKLIDGKDSAYFSQKLVKLCSEVPCSEIDQALNAGPAAYDFSSAAKVLSKYEVFNVAKSYAELALKNSASDSEAVRGEAAALKTDAQALQSQAQALQTDSFDQPALEVKENDTSSYRALTKLSELNDYIDAFLNSSEKILAYDSETSSLDTFNCSLLGFSLCYEEGKAVYVPLQQADSDLFTTTDYISQKDALKSLSKLLLNKDVTLVLHNAKFDFKVLLNAAGEKEFEKLIACKIYDTMIAAWLNNPERTGKNGYSLEYLGETQLGLKGIEFTDIVKKGQTFADVPLEQAYKYAAEDADFTLKLYKKQMEKNPDLKLFNMEMQVLPLLTQMEMQGIHLDTAFLNSYNQELTQSLILVINNIYKEVGHEFNIASPKQLQTVLFEERGLKPGKKTKTGYSTDTSVLEELAYEDCVPKMILEYRELAKLQSTYVETLPKLVDKEGRIHTDFVQTGTATGRLSCRDPNLQNIPVKSDAGRKIRSAFTAPEGKVLISADYAQIELVVLAHLSGDKNMCKSFLEGTDVHKATAAMIYKVPAEAVTAQMRRTAKTINFGVIYGMSAFRLAQDLGISRTQAANFIQEYFNMYSDVEKFINETIESASARGYIETLSGRRRPILNINSKNKIEKAAAERIAVNSPVQGSAADIVKLAMISVSEALKEKKSPAKLLLQVHDELIFECPDDQKTIDETIAIIKDKMENAVKLSVPLRVSVEYGKNWGEFH